MGAMQMYMYHRWTLNFGSPEEKNADRNHLLSGGFRGPQGGTFDEDEQIADDDFAAQDEGRQQVGDDGQVTMPPFMQHTVDVPMKTWRQVSDEEMNRWFSKLSFKRSSTPIGETFSLSELHEQVVAASKLIRQERQNLVVESLETSFFDDLQSVDRISKHDNVSPEKAKVDKSIKGDVPIISSESLCKQYTKARIQSAKFNKTMFSIAGTVPAPQVKVWRKIFEESLEWAEMKGDVSDMGNDFLRVLILPWNYEASLMVIPDDVLRKGFKYGVVFSRSLDDLSRTPLLSRRQNLVNALFRFSSRVDMFHGNECSLSTLGIRPAAFVLSDESQCTEFFKTFSMKTTGTAPWVMKRFATTSCMTPTSCVENDDTLYIEQSTALLKKFGRCDHSTTKTNLVVERAVVDQFMVHSKRIKLHVLLLVTSTTPWTVYINPGFVTFANSKTPKGGESSFMLPTETTEPRRQGGNGETWEWARFLRHLDTYGHCSSGKCDALWKRIFQICRLVIEMTTLEFSPRQQQNSKLGSFQITRLDFWLDSELRPFWQRGSADLGFLFQDNVDGTVVRRLFSQAVQVATDHTHGKSPDWDILKDEYQDRCEHGKKYSPCEAMTPIAITKTQDSRTYTSVEHANETSTAAQGQDKKASGGVQEANDTGDDAGEDTGDAVIAAEGTWKSPQSPLPMGRRAPRVDMDEL